MNKFLNKNLRKSSLLRSVYYDFYYNSFYYEDIYYQSYKHIILLYDDFKNTLLKEIKESYEQRYEKIDQNILRPYFKENNYLR